MRPHREALFDAAAEADVAFCRPPRAIAGAGWTRRCCWAASEPGAAGCVGDRRLSCVTGRSTGGCLLPQRLPISTRLDPMVHWLDAVRANRRLAGQSRCVTDGHDRRQPVLPDGNGHRASWKARGPVTMTSIRATAFRQGCRCSWWPRRCRWPDRPLRSTRRAHRRFMPIKLACDASARRRGRHGSLPAVSTALTICSCIWASRRCKR